MVSQNVQRSEKGPFVLRSLIADVPLSAEGNTQDIEINCVEFLESNLYIGTSASEILHFVQIPPDPADSSGEPTYILASRIPPEYASLTIPERPGVQQILLLPAVNKACILCNWTITFYSLPELSPIFGATQVPKCNWIGGIDLNSPNSVGGQGSGAVTVLISLNKKLRVVRIGEEARGIRVRVIDFAGSTISVRRGSFACVADSTSYALLDVDRQLKIPLFPISSLDNTQQSSIGGQIEDISGGSGIQRSTSSAQNVSHSASSSIDRGHSRSTSLGTFIAGSQRQGQSSRGRERSGRETPEQLLHEPSPHGPITTQNKGASPTKSSNAAEKPLPITPSEGPPVGVGATPLALPRGTLRPHIVSPSPQEFLLVTGTLPSDPGVGLFVNLEGDVTRSTLEFGRYPDNLVADGRGVGTEISQNNAEEEEEGYVLATMSRDNERGLEYGIEIQRWDLDPSEREIDKTWLRVSNLPNQEDDQAPRRIGIRSVMDPGDVNFDEVVERIRLKRFRPFTQKSVSASIISLQSLDSRTASSVERVSREQALFESQELQNDDSMPQGWEESRNKEELQFAKRLGLSKSRIAVWSGDSIWWAVRNPLISRIEASMEPAGFKLSEKQVYQKLDSRKVVEMINSLRGREAKTETEFVSLNYVRQLGGFLLFLSLINASSTPILDIRVAEDALIEGGLDPRVILATFPQLRNEVIEGKSGIWIFGGVKDVAENFDPESEIPDTLKVTEFVIPGHILQFFRRFLSSWRRKKGFGSIADENEVFRSVDASLLTVLLQLDKQSPRGPGKDGALKSELQHLVDHGMDCFDRAVDILETYHRLFELSRLYQSRKMAKEVLATWRRIVEGELDEGGEFIEGEQRMSEYLLKVSNPIIVQEYGVWLAGRNPRLGVQVFAEERSKVKFEPTQVVQILRQGAPNAVKDFLEHLVFGKNHTEYVNDLIAYYLDIVIHKLETSDEARVTMSQTYESYRALRPPKPTYRQFITDNAIQEEWWHSRLRLLQLLGGSQGSASEYDIEGILTRIKPFTQDLVPEVIILDGRRSRHGEALSLLTHGLGDYDTAINYCLLGGASIYHPLSGTRNQEHLPSREEQATLFGFLLAEFLEIEDISDRVEQTGSLLERFGGWFDVGYVLNLIPDTWSVELVSGFLVSALRRIVRERSETVIAKALSGAENLKISDDLIGKINEIGPSIEAA